MLLMLLLHLFSGPNEFACDCVFWSHDPSEKKVDISQHSPLKLCIREKFKSKISRIRA